MRCLKKWLMEFPEKYRWFPVTGRIRIADLVRKVHQSGQLEPLAIILHKVEILDCWIPWRVAIDAVLKGGEEIGLEDPKANKIYQLLSSQEGI